MNDVEQFDPNEMLGVMNTYAQVLPEQSILAENRRGQIHIIIPREKFNQPITLTNYRCLVNFCEARV